MHIQKQPGAHRLSALEEGLDAPELVTDLGHQGKGQSVVDAARVNRKGQAGEWKNVRASK